MSGNIAHVLFASNEFGTCCGIYIPICLCLILYKNPKIAWEGGEKGVPTYGWKVSLLAAAIVYMSLQYYRPHPFLHSNNLK